jgi:PhnB protein
MPNRRNASPPAGQIRALPKDPAEAERIFNALMVKGTVCMPLQQTFWPERFGMLADQFGIPWMINCEKAA